MKKIRWILLAVCLFCFCQGCGRNSASTASPAPREVRVAFVTNTKNDFWTTVRHGANRAAQDLGNVNVDFRYFAGSTVEDQEKVLSDLVADGVDGIAVSPIDADKETAFLNQIAAKTLLVCVDSDAANSKRVCFIGTDNFTAGKQAAELLKAALPKGGKTGICVGYPNAQNAKDRIRGLQEGLAGANIQIIGTLADATDPQVATRNAEDLMTQYPDLAGLAGLYSYDGPAILAAVRKSGKAGQVKIVCFDADSETLAGTADGEIYGTVIQISNRIGAETVTRMVRYLRGDKTQLSQGDVLFKTVAVNKGLIEYIQAWHDDNDQP